MIETRQTEAFARWFAGLRDAMAVRRIARRIALLEGGHYGDVKALGDKVSELGSIMGRDTGCTSRAGARR